MTPKTLYRLALAALTLALSHPAHAQEQEDESAQATQTFNENQVNVVLYLLDGVRADHVGAYGYGKPTTPALDALAKEAVVFDQAYAAAPTLLPSLAAFMSGEPPCSHGALTDGEKVNDAINTIARSLRKSGALTALVSSNPFSGEISGLDRGFVQPQMSPVLTAGPVERCIRKAGAPMLLYFHDARALTFSPVDPEKIAPFGATTQAERDEIAKLVQLIRGLARKDFDSKKPLGTTNNASQQKAVGMRFTDLKPKVEALYDTTLRDADEVLGKTIEALKAQNLWDNTLFIVASTTACEFGEHDGWLQDQSLYEEALRTPLIIRFPKNEFAGKRVASAVSLMDVFPTILDVLALKDAERPRTGRSLMPLIRGEQANPDEMRLIAMRLNKRDYFRKWKLHRGDRNFVARQGPWKGILNLDVDSFELYNLEQDPTEQKNLATQEVERAGKLREFLQSRLSDCAYLSVESNDDLVKTLNPDVKKALEDLGYINKGKEGDKPKKKGKGMKQGHP